MPPQYRVPHMFVELSCLWWLEMLVGFIGGRNKRAVCLILEMNLQLKREQIMYKINQKRNDCVVKK